MRSKTIISISAFRGVDALRGAGGGHTLTARYRIFYVTLNPTLMTPRAPLGRKTGKLVTAVDNTKVEDNAVGRSLYACKREDVFAHLDNKLARIEQNAICKVPVRSLQVRWFN